MGWPDYVTWQFQPARDGCWASASVELNHSRHAKTTASLVSADVRSPIALFIQCCVSLVCFRFFIVPVMIKPASVCTKSTVSPSRISRWRFIDPTVVLKVKLPEQSAFTVYVPVPVTVKDPPLEKLSVLTSFVIVPCPSQTA